MARLTHPHILPLHDSGEADGLLYYVMPFLEGESLRARLTRERQLPIDESARLLDGERYLEGGVVARAVRTLAGEVHQRQSGRINRWELITR